MTQDTEAPQSQPQAGGRGEAEPPPTLEQFNALPPAERSRVARTMTRAQRDRLLGRPSAPAQPSRYL